MTDLGTDVHCVSDFLAQMPLVSGRTALAHALARRLQTPRGMFPWWPDYGTDLRQYLLAHIDTQRISAAAQSECEKDERVAAVDITAATVTDTTVTLQIEVTPDESPDAVFEFVLTITQAKVVLVEV